MYGKEEDPEDREGGFWVWFIRGCEWSSTPAGLEEGKGLWGGSGEILSYLHTKLLLGGIPKAYWGARAFGTVQCKRFFERSNIGFHMI